MTQTQRQSTYNVKRTYLREALRRSSDVRQATRVASLVKLAKL